MPYNDLNEEKKICKRCNKEFPPKQHNAIFCFSCKNKKKIKNKIEECILCKNKFQPINSTHKKYCKLCSTKKRNEIKNKQWNNWYKNKYNTENGNIGVCVICKDNFIKHSKLSKYCKKESCKNEYLKIKAKNKYHKNKKQILERRKNNINEMIKLKLRMRISCAVKSQGANKADKTMNLVGCSIKELKEHLKENFKVGMNWNNYGRYGWVIDHIMPCSKFNLTNKEEQRKCFHYTNLQPLWFKENLVKHDKVEL